MLGTRHLPDQRQVRCREQRASDLALASAKWSVSGTGPDGQPITLGGVSADILRRQADGSWRYVIDQPWGDQMTAG